MRHQVQQIKFHSFKQQSDHHLPHTKPKQENKFIRKTDHTHTQLDTSKHIHNDFVYICVMQPDFE